MASYRPLVVVLGAGASFGCATDPMPRKVDVQPPLVTTLFAPTYFHILDKYPIARHAGAEVRRAIAVAATSNDSFAVEKFIRDNYEHSSNPSDKRKALALPWYLQDLLWAASRFYTKNPDKYDVLVSETLRLGDVIFVTLNYDVILDSILETYSPREVAIKERGQVRLAGRVKTSREQLELFTQSLGPDDQVALEASSPALAVARMLEPHVGRVVIANPRKLRAIAESKVKTDRLDARTLRELLDAGFLPAVWSLTIGRGRCGAGSLAAPSWSGNAPATRTSCTRCSRAT